MINKRRTSVFSLQEGDIINLHDNLGYMEVLSISGKDFPFSSKGVMCTCRRYKGEIITKAVEGGVDKVFNLTKKAPYELKKGDKFLHEGRFLTVEHWGYCLPGVFIYTVETARGIHLMESKDVVVSPANTPINKTGWVPVEDLKIGDVVVHNGCLKEVESVVTNTVCKTLRVIMYGVKFKRESDFYYYKGTHEIQRVGSEKDAKYMYPFEILPGDLLYSYMNKSWEEVKKVEEELLSTTRNVYHLYCTDRAKVIRPKKEEPNSKKEDVVKDTINKVHENLVEALQSTTSSGYYFPVVSTEKERAPQEDEETLKQIQEQLKALHAGKESFYNVTLSSDLPKVEWVSCWNINKGDVILEDGKYQVVVDTVKADGIFNRYSLLETKEKRIYSTLFNVHKVVGTQEVLAKDLQKGDIILSGGEFVKVEERRDCDLDWGRYVIDLGRQYRLYLDFDKKCVIYRPSNKDSLKQELSNIKNKQSELQDQISDLEEKMINESRKYK